MGLSNNTPRQVSKDLIYISSLVATAMALYSTSDDDVDTVACFLGFQDIGDPSSVTKYPVNDLLESGHAPKFESRKPKGCKLVLAFTKIPSHALSFRLPST